MAKIRKAVIPAAGMGTRFLPVTRVVPKEMLPIVTVPTLQIAVEEALKSSIEEVVLVVSPKKQEIVRYFQEEPFLCSGRIKISAAIQESPKGLGHAVLSAKDAVGNEPFIVILPDVLIESEIPCCKQLISAFENTGKAINATEHTPRNKLHLYGIYDISSSSGRFHTASRVIEKPKEEEAPSDFSVVGRYLFPPEIFSILEETPPGRGGEIQLADAMDTLAKQGQMIAYEYEGRQFDTGDPEGFLKANIFYGCKKYPGSFDDLMKEMLNMKR